MTTETKTKHTPLPWQIGESGKHLYYVNPKIEAGDEEIDDPSHDSVVAQCDHMGPLSGIPDEERKANARFIFRACNSHDDLLEVLQRCSEYFHDFTEEDREERELADLCRAAIAKAKGADNA